VKKDMRGGGLQRRDCHSTRILFWRVLLDFHRGEFEFYSQED
jgi:hypothetical protein